MTKQCRNIIKFINVTDSYRHHASGTSWNILTEKSSLQVAKVSPFHLILLTLSVWLCASSIYSNRIMSSPSILPMCKDPFTHPTAK